MPKTKKADLVGERFGLLVVIARDYPPSRRLHWWCGCDCGMTTTVTRANLESGRQISCGCHGRRMLIVTRAARKKTDAELRATRKRVHQRWLDRNPEYISQKYQRDKADPERWGKILARARDWRRANMEHKNALTRNRRAKLREATGAHTGADVLEILRRQGNKCAICRAKLDGKYHADHITPISRGGSNGKENIQVLCGPCNLTKSGRDPIENMQRLGWLL